MLGFMRYRHRHGFFANHSTCRQAPEFISEYIASEQRAGRYSRAYSPDELEKVIGPFWTSPLGLVPKPHSNKFRMIQDLSYPRNEPNIASVNAGVNSDDFPTAWGKFEDVINMILSLPRGCKAATFDISAAYCVTPILPSQQAMLCIFWQGLVYVDRALMFGLASSAGVFGAIADMLVAIYAALGITLILKWVDDFLVIRRPNETWTEEEFMAKTAAIGVPWSKEKMRPFATVQRYIGFDWDLDQKVVSLPTEKIVAAMELLQLWSSEGATFSMKEAASLHGKLVHVSSIFRLIRPFLPSISTFLKDFTSQRARLHVPGHVKGDVKFMLDIIKVSPNSMPLGPCEPRDIGWWGDASTSFGIGIVIGSAWAVWCWKPGFSVGPGHPHDIGWAEAVAVEVGLRLLQKLQGLKPGPGGYLVRSDNMGVVTVVGKGRSRNSETNNILKQIYRIQASRI